MIVGNGDNCPDVYNSNQLDIDGDRELRLSIIPRDENILRSGRRYV